MDDHRAPSTEVFQFPFCDQLEKFIKYIGNVRELNFLTYDYPNILKNRLDENVSELKTVLAEVKDAAANADRLKRQKICVKKDKIVLKKTLKRMRDAEVREMECLISLYDKPMFARWENVKSTQKPEVLEGILSDIKGKQLALENLNILVTRRLNHIQIVQPILSIEAENSRAGLREKTIIPLPFPSFCPPFLPPPPPPLPPPPISISCLPKRSHAQRLSVQRRRRLERRDENLERRCVVAENVEDLSLVPLTFGELPDSFYSRLIGATSNSSHDVVSTSRTNDPDLRNRNNNANDESNGARGLEIEFRNEMRTVLQALFGDLRSTPTLLPTDIINSESREPENAANEDREIELYAMEKRQ